VSASGPSATGGRPFVFWTVLRTLGSAENPDEPLHLLTSSLFSETYFLLRSLLGDNQSCCLHAIEQTIGKEGPKHACNYWFGKTDFRGNTEFLSQPHYAGCWAWINWSDIGSTRSTLVWDRSDGVPSGGRARFLTSQGAGYR